tara:strand:+ start:108 stop:797 length:690 start_codon:yes stop_codon:yes gene_type:complete
LKGATGAGVPIIIIPIISAFYDVRLGVVIMVIPNVITNIHQLYIYRKSILPLPLTFAFALGGGLGAIIGTVFLANLSLDSLSIGMGCVVLAYITFKLFVPSWHLIYQKSKGLFFPIGFFGGILQGASGISAPLSITFLNSMKLTRETFISTISVYFMVMAFFQTPALIYYKFIGFDIVFISVLCTFVLLLSMPVGARIAKSISINAFDKLILILLGIITCKIFFDILIN